VIGGRNMEREPLTTSAEIREPIKMTEENAWIKDYDYHYNQADDNWRFINKLTGEEIPLTQEQYRDTNYTIERARAA